MSLTIKGVVAGINSGDTLNTIEFVWKISATEGESAAVTAGRSLTFTVPTDNTAIAEFQTATGTLIAAAWQEAGVTYHPAVRITKTRADAAQIIGPWNSGTPFMAPRLTFETDFGSYTNEAPAKVTRDTVIKRSGSYSSKWVADGAAPYPQLSRTVTFPSTGITTFIRHFLYSGTPAGSFQVWGIAPDNTVASWVASVYFETNYGIRYNNGSVVTILAAGSMTADVWYKVVITVDWATKTISVKIYNEAEQLIGMAAYTNSVTLSGSKCLLMGRSVPASTYYLDDCDDGGL